MVPQLAGILSGHPIHDMLTERVDFSPSEAAPDPNPPLGRRSHMSGTRQT